MQIPAYSGDCTQFYYEFTGFGFDRNLFSESHKAVK